MIEAGDVKALFPILQRTERGKPFVYLDSAASAQTPLPVLDAMDKFYQQDYSNVHRGVSSVSVRATQAYENARVAVQRFMRAASADEIVFTKGTTDSINLLAYGLGESFLREGDEILVSVMEHHSNLVPWQQAAKRAGCSIREIPVSPEGEISVETVAKCLTSKTKLIAITHVSNVLGTVNPIAEICELAHQHGVLVSVDGAQAAPHLALDMQALDCDFYAFSGHKLYGPTGIGVLYGKSSLLRDLPPYQTGGGMIERVSMSESTFLPAPARFEAGTPPIAEAVGLQAAIEWIEHIGFEAIQAEEARLTQRALETLQGIKGIKILGNPATRVSVISFTMDGVHPHDIGTVLDDAGVAVRAGHHCCMPLMAHFGVAATLRISVGIYNTDEDITCLGAALAEAERMFAL